MELPSALSNLSLQNFSPKNFLYFFLKKICPEKISDNFSIKYFLIFQETELSCIFSKESFSYISGNGNAKKIFIFLKMELS